MKIYEQQTLQFGEESSISLPADSPVSHTAQPESERVKMMTATSGRKCLEQFERFNQVGSWAKTFAGLLIGMEGWYSTRCNLTWKLKATRCSRFYFQLQASDVIIDENGYGLLPTISASGDGRKVKEDWVWRNGYYKKGNGKKVQSDIRHVLSRHGLKLRPPFAAHFMGYPEDWLTKPFQGGNQKVCMQQVTP